MRFLKKVMFIYLNLNEQSKFNKNLEVYNLRIRYVCIPVYYAFYHGLFVLKKHLDLAVRALIGKVIVPLESCYYSQSKCQKEDISTKGDKTTRFTTHYSARTHCYNRPWMFVT